MAGPVCVVVGVTEEKQAWTLPTVHSTVFEDVPTAREPVNKPPVEFAGAVALEGVSVTLSLPQQS